MTSFELKVASPRAWIDAVLSDFDSFLLDHAANERKASAMAMSMVAHYPDKTVLVQEMIDLALEELNHFRQVVRLIAERGLQLAPDEKDTYVNRMRAATRQHTDEYFLDRLLSAAVIECRGAERFALLAENIQQSDLQSFYARLANSEQNHYQLFVDLSSNYFSEGRVTRRMHEWLDIEAQILVELPIRPRLH